MSRAPIVGQVLGWTLAVACHEPATTPADAPREDDAATGPCVTYALPPREVEVREPELIEVSGLVASRAHPGVLWAHNDSGDRARVFAIGVDGAALGELAVPASMVDAEDLAIAPCPDAAAGGAPWCLWIADTGDNTRSRADAALIAVAEPEVGPDAPLGQAVAPRAWRFPVRYPASVSVDVEALAIAGGRVILFEKVDAASARVFAASLPAVDGDGIELAELAILASPGVPITYGQMITGADLHPLGDRLALRVYTGVYEYRLPAGSGLEDLARAERVEVTLGPLSERQGEAIAYDPREGGLWTMSEDPDLQATQPLHRFDCAP